MQLQPQPARNFGAAHIGKAGQFGEVGNRHDAGHDGDFHAAPAHVVEEAEVGVGIEEKLGDGGIGAGFHFAHEALDVVFGAARLRVVFGVGSHFDVEPVAESVADELHQFVGVVQAGGAQAHAGGDVAAQGNHVADAQIFVFLQEVGEFAGIQAHAGDVRGGGHAFGKDVADGLHGAFAGGAAGAGGAGEKLGLVLGELLAGDFLFFAAFGRAGGEKFEAEGIV